MGIPDHLTCLLRNMYEDQAETVQTGHGTKGVCQGCLLSPLHETYITFIQGKS